MKNIVLTVVFLTLLSSQIHGAVFMWLVDIKGEAIDKSNSTQVISGKWMAPESL